MNIHANFPSLFKHDTTVLDLDFGDNYTLVELKENIVRAAGGGQPRDKAQLILNGKTYEIEDVVKKGGKTWLKIGEKISNNSLAKMAVVIVDEEYRLQLSKTHSLTHLVMASLKLVVDGFTSQGAEISDTGKFAELTFGSKEELTEGLIAQVEILSRVAMNSNLSITSEIVKPTKTQSAVEIAERSFSHWRVNPGLSLTGKVRVIHIADLDSNPCSGSHVSNTEEIGPFVFQNVRKSDNYFKVKVLRTDVWQKWYGELSLLNCDRIDPNKIPFYNK